MQTLEWTTVDKSEWGMGAWQNEPDKKQWQDEETGYPCLIVRGPSGALCGYVGVPIGHPYYMIDYHQCDLGCEDSGCGHSPDCRIDVHGGLTFSGFCTESEDPSQHICHLVEPGEEDKAWWLGFDCAHSGDISPAYQRFKSPNNFGLRFEAYRDLGYITQQIKNLARQLKGVAT